MNKFYTVQEVADILKVRRHTVYRWIYAGRLKAHRISRGVVRIEEQELERFIKRGE